MEQKKPDTRNYRISLKKAAGSKKVTRFIPYG